jgi:hypothetical protein
VWHFFYGKKLPFIRWKRDVREILLSEAWEINASIREDVLDYSLSKEPVN